MLIITVNTGTGAGK